MPNKKGIAVNLQRRLSVARGRIVFAPTQRVKRNGADSGRLRFCLIDTVSALVHFLKYEPGAVHDEDNGGDEDGQSQQMVAPHLLKDV